MRVLLYTALAIVLVPLVYFRAVPHPADKWHIDLSDQGEGEETGPGSIRVSIPAAVALETMARLEALILATPRTTRLAGSASEGHASYVTRSLIYGFPDTTTVQALEGRIVVYARLRFGVSDLGVNANRVRGWLDQL